MGMIDWILILIIAVIAAAALISVYRRMKHGSSCCGTKEAAVKRVRPGKTGAQFRVLTLDIGGMTCDNCAARVQNALNAIPGVSAKVRISDRKAQVKCREDVETAALKEAVAKAGYVVMKITE